MSMKIVSDIAVSLVAILHIYFLILEMFFWTKPLGLKVFRQTQDQALSSSVLAANQGLYNGFLAAGLIWGLLHPNVDISFQIKIFFLSCVIVAGLYGAYSVGKKILFVQMLPALGALLLVFTLTSCVYGPKVEYKNSLNALNGENYVASQETPPSSLIVVGAKRKERLTEISGKVFLQREGQLPIVMNKAKMILINPKNEAMQEFTTSAGGEFKIHAVLPNGMYSIKINSTEYSGETKFEVKNYNMKNIDVFVK